MRLFPYFVIFVVFYVLYITSCQKSGGMMGYDIDLYHIYLVFLLYFSYISIMRKRFVAQGNALIFVHQSSHFVSVFIKRVFNISGIKARGLSLRSSVSAQHLKSQLHFWSSLPTGLCGHTNIKIVSE